MMRTQTGIFAFDATLDPDRFAADIQDWGVDEAILHPGFFADARMERALHRAGRSLWLNLPVFYNPSYLAAHPQDYAITPAGNRAIHDWSHFVCPTTPGYVAMLESDFATLARRLKPHRISLDFIRHFVFWEAVSPDGDPAAIVDGCYCPRCRAAFGEHAGTTVDEPETLRGSQRVAWAQWKCSLITDTARRLITAVRDASPDSRFLIKTIPWRPSEFDGAIGWGAGQDIAALGHLVDALAPMAFAHLPGRGAAWKRALLEEVRRRSGRVPVSYVQAVALPGNESIDAETVAAELREALAGPGECVPLFCYDQMMDRPDVVAAIRRVLRDRAEVW